MPQPIEEPLGRTWHAGKRGKADRGQAALCRTWHAGKRGTADRGQADPHRSRAARGEEWKRRGSIPVLSPSSSLGNVGAAAVDGHYREVLAVSDELSAE